MERPLALVVEKDPNARSLIAAELDEAGFATAEVARFSDVPSAPGGGGPAVVFIDREAAELSGPSSREIGRIRERLGDVAVVVLGGDGADDAHAPPDTWFAWLSAGALDVVPKPLDPMKVRAAAARARALVLPDAGSISPDPLALLVGDHRGMATLRTRIQFAASRDAPVLFVGEPGSGRELGATVVHRLSSRSGGPFIAVRAARHLPGDVSRLLFGGDGDRGALAAARGGSLFLGDVARLPLDCQSELAGFLERLDGNGSGPAGADAPDIRVLASSGDDLAHAVDEGRFLEGLYARLSAFTVRIPPLRERRDDIPGLATHFLRSICKLNGIPPIGLSSKASEALVRYDWPDNVRELRNAMEQAAILAVDRDVRPDDLPRRVVAPVEPGATGDAQFGAGRTFKQAKADVVQAFEKRYLDALMRRNSGNVTVAARESGMLRSALQRLLRKHGLRSVEFREERSPAPRVDAPSVPVRAARESPNRDG